MIINDKGNSVTNKSLPFQSTLEHSSVASSIAIDSKLKKRKIIILGKMGVGKSSIIQRFVDNSLPDRPQLTNEEVFTKNYFYKNEEVKLVMIDTAGQSEFTPALPNRYCIGVHAYILAFSIDDNLSFEVVQHVNKILLDGIGTKYIPRILVGNKRDLESFREVSEDRIKKLAKAWKCPYIECSAKEGGAEIERIFYKLLKEVAKESNDEYPYDIKNSTIGMNYIRKHHKAFNMFLMILMTILISSGVFLFIYSCVISFSTLVLFSPFLLLNLFFSLLLSLNSFRALRIYRKQLHYAMNSVNVGMYITLLMNIVLFILTFFKFAISDKVWNSFEAFNPTTLYIFLIFIQIWSVIVGKNLEPLYKEFYTTTSLSQQLLVKI